MRNLLLAIIFLNISYCTLAQTRIGIKGGYQFCQVSFDPVVNQNYINGYAGGLALKYISQPHLGFIIEVNYSQKGWYEYTEIEEFGNLYYQRQLNYIEIPMFSHFYLGDKSRIFLNAGPSFGYLHSFTEKYNVKQVFDADGKLVSEGLRRPKGYYNQIKYEFALAGGIGFEQRTRIGGFTLEARVTHGLTNIVERPEPKSTDYSQSQVLSVFLVYYFDFLKKTSKTDEPVENK